MIDKWDVGLRYHIVLDFSAKPHSFYLSGSLRLGQILKNQNPEMDLGFSSVHPGSPSLN
jgi:hypothetical protein